MGATILWASNGEFYIKFIDSLYISVSGATGTGLVTTDLSALTIWQQVVLVVLELIGNQVSAILQCIYAIALIICRLLLPG